MNLSDTGALRRPLLTRNWKGKTERLPDIVFVDAEEEPSRVELQAEQARRQNAEEQGPLHEPDGLDICLDCWCDWMHRHDTDLGIKGQRTLRAEGDGYGGEDTSKMRRENEIAEATDAMFRSLSTSHQWAIRRKCGIATVWRFPNLDYMAEALAACAELEKKLRNNVATRLLFG